MGCLHITHAIFQREAYKTSVEHVNNLYARKQVFR